MFYAVTDLKKKKYTGFRYVQADWDLKENETLVKSLDGLTQIEPQQSSQAPLNEVYELTSLMGKLDSTQINALKQAVLAILEA
jgi:hypothetical protein